MSVASGLVVSASVECSAGKKPLGGGYEPLIPGTPPTPSTGNTATAVFLSQIVSAPTVSGWTVALRNSSGTLRSNVQFRVWATCAVQP
jgi:hypothetical protein